MNAHHRSFIGASAGGFVALGVAMAFVPLRDTLGNVNVALALAVIVVASIVIDVRGRVIGRFVLATTPRAPVPDECRLVAFALADQPRVALAAAAA